MHITNEITMGMIINWLVTLGVGGVIFGLLKYTFKREKELLLSKIDHSRNAHSGFLTEMAHDTGCKETIKELITSRRMDIKDAIENQTKILDGKFEAVHAHIELVVFKGLKGFKE